MHLIGNTPAAEVGCRIDGAERGSLRLGVAEKQAGCPWTADTLSCEHMNGACSVNA